MVRKGGTPKKEIDNTKDNIDEVHEAGGKCRFEGFGEEMIEKKVKLSGNSGRVYVPPEWVGKQVKIIRID